MVLFETLPSEDKEFEASIIDATHQWGLPGLICEVCGNTWSGDGLAYPLVQLSDFPFEDEYRTPRAVSLDEFLLLKKKLAAVLPPGTMLPPGTEFGPLKGKARGPFGDFAWLNPWTPLMKIRAYSVLREAGVRLPQDAGHNLTFTRPDDDQFVELQVEPYALLKDTAKDSQADGPCIACGYYPLSLPDRIVIEQSSIPTDVDLFRAKNFTTLILATAAFVKSTAELNLTGVKFREVEVS